MTGSLANIDRAFDLLADGLTDVQVSVLRQTHRRLADEIDRAAMRDVEGASDWRDLQNTGDRYADR